MIRLVTALDCEARPLIAHYKLKRDNQARGFPLYRSRDGADIALIVAGIGRVAAGAAVAYLDAWLKDQTAAWLNLGVGGHRGYALGSAVLADKVTEAATAKCWYPPPVIAATTLTAAAISQAEVVSVEQPQTDYPRDVVYEMEAAGFYATACRFTTAELVQVVKIISDNAASSVAQLDAALVETLIADQMTTISAVVAELSELARMLNGLASDPPGYAQLVAQFRFSQAERQRLRDGLRRWAVLYPSEAAALALPNAALSDGKTLLRWLAQRTALR